MKRASRTSTDETAASVRFTRDPVCLSDDVEAPRERWAEVPPSANPTQLAGHLRSGYLARVAAGRGRSWSCRLNGRAVATVGGKRIEAQASALSYRAVNDVHFAYRSAPW